MGGPGGRGPPEFFLKIGFRMVLFQSNFLHIRRNIAAYNTLYTYSPLLSIFSETPPRPKGQAIWGVRGAVAPRKVFLKIGFKIVLFQSNFQHFRRNIAA